MKFLVLSRHAETVLVERGLDMSWVRLALDQPDWREPDPSDPALERRFRVIPERGARILRVVCKEDDDSIRLVTAFFDRRARKPA